MRILLVPAVLVALLATGCVSAFPPSSLDYGRGPAPLEQGTLRIQAGGGGGVAPLFFAGGAAVGARAELQVSEHLAVGVDGGAGLQLQPLILVAPFGGHLSTQVNPGLKWLALRASLGVGGDISAPGGLPLPVTMPWLSAAGSLVLGTSQEPSQPGSLDPYLSLNLGMRQYVGELQPFDGQLPQTLDLHRRVYAAGATLGLAWRATEVLSLYGALNGTAVLIEGYGDPLTGRSPLGISPVASLQGGVAFQF